MREIVKTKILPTTFLVQIGGIIYQSLVLPTKEQNNKILILSIYNDLKDTTIEHNNPTNTWVAL